MGCCGQSYSTGMWDYRRNPASPQPTYPDKLEDRLASHYARSNGDPAIPGGYGDYAQSNGGSGCDCNGKVVNAQAAFPWWAALALGALGGWLARGGRHAG